MHVHVIMHNLPRYITTPMHQYMFILICMVIVFKQSKTLTSIKEIKPKKNKSRETEAYRYIN